MLSVRWLCREDTTKDVECKVCSLWLLIEMEGSNSPTFLMPESETCVHGNAFIHCCLCFIKEDSRLGSINLKYKYSWYFFDEELRL